MSSKVKINAIDLFCGAGGLSYGLQQGGINVVAGIDLDPACQFPYSANNNAKFILQSVEHVSGEQLETFFPNSQLKLLAGCAPCQAFSTYTQAQRIPKNKKWVLVNHFLRLIGEVKPEFVTMENVSNLKREAVFEGFVETLKKMGYFVWFRVVDCSSYGVPQRRHRLVLLASLLTPLQLIEPEPNRVVTVRDIIGELPPLAAGEVARTDPLHRASQLSSINLQRIRVSTPGGTWRDWPRGLVAICHQNKSGKTYPSVYGRMKWDDVSPTITTQFYGFGNGRFGHPEQDRALSLREGAMLQTFPKEYKFVDSNSNVRIKTIGRLIGNAVPVRLGEMIAKSILSSLK